MIDLIFGIFLTGFMTFLTFGLFEDGKTIDVGVIFILGIFWVVGIYLIISGIKKIIIDSLTNKKGEICYGKVINIYNSGTYVNNRPELKVDILVYIFSTQETKTISEIIGFDMNKYQIGSYVRLKYYNGDINIEEVVDSSSLSLDAQDILVSSQNLETHNTVLNDTIIIDGVEYVRKDSINSKS